jgi:Arc/MetJ family transcription regulator
MVWGAAHRTSFRGCTVQAVLGRARGCPLKPGFGLSGGEARKVTSFDAIISAMRTTVALDDDLLRTAQEFTGVAEKTALIREALKALIERESARRLASLEGTMPRLKNIPRRRPGTKSN